MYKRGGWGNEREKKEKKKKMCSRACIIMSPGSLFDSYIYIYMNVYGGRKLQFVIILRVTECYASLYYTYLYARQPVIILRYKHDRYGRTGGVPFDGRRAESTGTSGPTGTARRRLIAAQIIS